MKHFKNFKAVAPCEADREQFGDMCDQIIFLAADDGARWYSAVSEFKDSTFKIMYDADGIIRSITNDASTLNPANCSVVEVSKIPDGCTHDGSWMYDGKKIKARVKSEDEIKEANLSTLRKLRRNASDALLMLQCVTAPTDEQKRDIDALTAYLADLSAVSLTDASPDWPTAPDITHL